MKALLDKVLFNESRGLRNGWWLLIFLVCVAGTRLLYQPVTHSLKDLGLAAMWLEPAPLVFMLLATWICTRLRKEPLSSIGLRLDRCWFKDAGIGIALGVLMMAVVAALIWAVGGVRFELDPARSVSTLSYGFYMFIWVALFEEVMLRGFLFQRLLAGTGIWVAQIGIALLFATGHWDNPGMDGATKFWASLDLGLAAIWLGLAYIRTGSLALPVGLHLGWNWAQGHILGFGVSGVEQAGWWRPVFQGLPDWVSGGAFGPESSVFSPVVSLLAIVLLWRWKGAAPASLPAPGPVTAIVTEPLAST